MKETHQKEKIDDAHVFDSALFVLLGRVSYTVLLFIKPVISFSGPSLRAKIVRRLCSCNVLIGRVTLPRSAHHIQHLSQRRSSETGYSDASLKRELQIVVRISASFASEGEIGRSEVRLSMVASSKGFRVPCRT